MLEIPISKEWWKPFHEFLDEISQLKEVEEVLFFEERSLYESNVFVVVSKESEEITKKVAEVMVRLKSKYPWASLSPMVLEKNSPLIRNVKNASKEEWHAWKQVAQEVKSELLKIQGVEECVVLEPEEYVWESNVFVVVSKESEEITKKVAEVMVRLKSKYPWASLSPMVLEKNSVAYTQFVEKGVHSA